jgi:putative ABC transport system substrate-binding protein
MVGSDPVELGLVASLNHPGGNLTGVAYLNAEVAPKRLEMLHQFVPSAKSIALLVNPANPRAAEAQAKELEAAVHSLGLRLSLRRFKSASIHYLAIISINLLLSPLGIRCRPFTRGENLR